MRAPSTVSARRTHPRSPSPVQFIRRCDKVAIIDHGKFQYFGPFNPTAQTILARYLPVPEEEHVAAAAEKPRAKEAAKVVLSKPEPKPRTALGMGAAAWRYLNAGPAWKCILAVSLGLVSQSSRQMSDFWIRAWASDEPYGWCALPLLRSLACPWWFLRHDPFCLLKLCARHAAHVLPLAAPAACAALL